MSANEARKVVHLNNVRLSYAYLFQPFTGKNDAGKETRTFCLHALMDADHPGVVLMRAAQRAVAAAAWGAQADAVLQNLAATDKLCMHKGDITKMGQEDYAGKLYVSANGRSRPRIVATRGGVNVEVQEGDADAPYSGCYANVIVEVYAQSPNGKPSKWGKRINAQLMGVQFVAHGEAFGGGKIANVDEFGVVAEGADADAPAAVSQDVDGLI